MYKIRRVRVAIVIAITTIVAQVAFGTPSRSADPGAFVRPYKRDNRVYTMLVASCPSTAVAEKLAQRLFTSLVWEDSMKLLLEPEMKTVRREISAVNCVVVDIPKQIDHLKMPETAKWLSMIHFGPLFVS